MKSNLIGDLNLITVFCKLELERMAKLGDKMTKYCEYCKTPKNFLVSEISEYGGLYGVCETCKVSMRLN